MKIGVIMARGCGERGNRFLQHTTPKLIPPSGQWTPSEAHAVQNNKKENKEFLRDADWPPDPGPAGAAFNYGKRQRRIKGATTLAAGRRARTAFLDCLTLQAKETRCSSSKTRADLQDGGAKRIPAPPLTGEIKAIFDAKSADSVALH